MRKKEFSVEFRYGELARAPSIRPTHRRALGADKAIREEAGCKVRLVIGEEMKWVGGRSLGRCKSVTGKRGMSNLQKK